MLNLLLYSLRFAVTLFLLGSLAASCVTLVPKPGEEEYKLDADWFLRSAEKNDIEVLERLLNNYGKPFLQLKSSRDSTALQLAVVRGHLESVQLLLNSGADPNIYKGLQHGDSLLHYSVRHLSPKITQTLILAGADPTIANKKFTDAYQLALIMEKEEHAQFIETAYPSSKRAMGLTASCLTRARSEKKALELLQAGAEINVLDAMDRSILYNAIKSNSSEVFSFLLNHGVETSRVHQNGSTYLHAAAKYARPKMLKALLSLGANPNATDRRGQTPLHVLCRMDFTNKESGAQSLRTLLHAGADPEAQSHSGKTPSQLALQISTETPGYSVLRSDFLTLLRNLEFEWAQILMTALRKDDLVVVQRMTAFRCVPYFLIKQSKRVIPGLLSYPQSKSTQVIIAAATQQTRGHWLSWAINSGDPAVVQMLLAFGISPTIQLANKSTSLSLAASTGNPDILNLLFDSGAVLSTNLPLDPAFSIALSSNNSEILDILVERGGPLPTGEALEIWNSALFGHDKTKSIASQPNNLDSRFLMTKKLLDYGVPTPDNPKLLAKIVSSCSAEIIFSSLNSVTTRPDFSNLLGEAILNGEAAVTALLSLGAKPNNKKDFSTLLFAVTQQASSKTLKNLIQAGAQVNLDKPALNGRKPYFNKTMTPLDYAEWHGNKVAAATLRSNNAVNRLDIMAAMKAQNIDRLEEIIQARPHVLSQNGGNLATPLHWATASGDYNIVQWVFESSQPDIQALDQDGCSILHYGARNDAGDAILGLAKMDLDLPWNLPNSRGDSPIHVAARSGFSSSFIALALGGAHIYQANSSGDMPNIIAGDDIKILQAILQVAEQLNEMKSAAQSGHLEQFVHDNDIPRGFLNVPSPQGESILGFAVKNDLTKAVTYLLSQGVRVNTRNAAGRTPLFAAAINSKNEILLPLLAAGADPSIAENNGKLPVFYAAMLDKTKVVRRLITAGIPKNTDENGLSLIETTLLARAHSTLKMLNQLGWDPSAPLPNGSTPLQWALAKQLFAESLLLLEMNADPNRVPPKSTPPLHLAVQKNSQQLTEALVAAGAQINKLNPIGASALHSAIVLNNDKLVAVLLNLGADPNLMTDIGSPLAVAAYVGNLNCVRLILQKKVDLNAHAPNQLTPMTYAARAGKSKIIQALAQAGASLTELDGRHSAPLAYAVENNYLDIARLLIRLGVSVETPVSTKERRPLHVAAALGQNESTRWLVKELKAQLNSRDALGLTPIFYAVANDHLVTTQTLLDLGANIHVQSNKGVELKSYAKNPAIKKLLQ